VPVGGPASRAAEELDHSVTGNDTAYRRARLPMAATAVNLTCSNACNPDLWSFGAPDRSITIPNGDWSALEPLP
jgi:hypothetical protein